ncbi:MAG: hypothetical protein ACRYFS_14480 [Janthinobacterium lividum]
MSEQGPASIGGGWLGTYAYKGALSAQTPVRFEATVAEPDSEGRFTGSILDDGNLGEADIRGEQSGSGIRFSKAYRRRGQPGVSYEGTLSDDGLTMQGTWQIAGAAHGVWDARRAWSENGTAQVEDVEEEQEQPRVREVVRLG